MLDLVKEVEALVKENAKLRQAVASATLALNPRPILLSDLPGKPFRAAPQKRKRTRKAKAAKGGTRGRKNKFDDKAAQEMAAQQKAGTTLKKLASDWKASIPTIMRTIQRVNGAHA